MECLCRSIGTCAVHKAVPIWVLIADKLNYFMTSLWGKNKIEIKNSMHNYNFTLVHRHHTLGFQCSRFSSEAVHKVVPVKQPKRYWRMDGQTQIVILIIVLVTRNHSKTRLLGRPQPQMYPPVALNQYTLVNRTHKHYIYSFKAPQTY